MQFIAKRPRFGIWKKFKSAGRKGANRGAIRSVIEYLEALLKVTNIRGPSKATPRQSDSDHDTKRNIVYLAKSEIHAFGFLQEDCRKWLGKSTLQMTKKGAIDGLERIWSERWADQISNHRKPCKNDVRFIISISEEHKELIHEAGLDSNQVLLDCVQNVMENYQKKYYPGEKLGYLAGVHRDRPHAHVHVLLFPCLESGREIRITDEGRSGGRKPFQFFLKEVDRYLERHFRREVARNDPMSMGESRDQIRPSLCRENDSNGSDQSNIARGPLNDEQVSRSEKLNVALFRWICDPLESLRKAGRRGDGEKQAPARGGYGGSRVVRETDAASDLSSYIYADVSRRMKRLADAILLADALEPQEAMRTGFTERRWNRARSLLQPVESSDGRLVLRSPDDVDWTLAKLLEERTQLRVLEAAAESRDLLSVWLVVWLRLDHRLKMDLERDRKAVDKNSPFRERLDKVAVQRDKVVKFVGQVYKSLRKPSAPVSVTASEPQATKSSPDTRSYKRHEPATELPARSGSYGAAAKIPPAHTSTGSYKTPPEPRYPNYKSVAALAAAAALESAARRPEAPQPPAQTSDPESPRKSGTSYKSPVLPLRPKETAGRVEPGSRRPSELNEEPPSSGLVER